MKFKEKNDSHEFYLKMASYYLIIIDYYLVILVIPIQETNMFIEYKIYSNNLD